MSQTSFSHDQPGTGEDQWTAPLSGMTTLPWSQLSADRIAVIAPHPDDETLGAGGLITGACTAGRRVTVVSCTDGEAAYGGNGSAAAALGRRRRAELADALARLAGQSGVAPVVIHGELPDGALAERRDELTGLIRAIAADVDLVVGPWPGDGHPDHAAVGAACRVVADVLGLPLLEYPVWMWHWGTEATIAGLDLVALPLTPAQRDAKRGAVTTHASQVTSQIDGPHGTSSTARAPILSAEVLAHFDRDVEVYVDRRGAHRADFTPPSTSSAEFFDAVYAASPGHDPWEFGVSTIELDRYDAIVAHLSDRTYESCFEPGCSIGELSIRLATISRQVVAMDFAPHAIEEARRRHGTTAAIDFRCGALPSDLPRADAPFDLIVLSEVGYYFDTDHLGAMTRELLPLLAPGGRLLAAHWTGSSPDHVLSGETTHDVIRAHVPWPTAGAEDRGTYLLETWDRP